MADDRSICSLDSIKPDIDGNDTIDQIEKIHQNNGYMINKLKDNKLTKIELQASEKFPKPRWRLSSRFSRRDNSNAKKTFGSFARRESPNFMIPNEYYNYFDIEDMLPSELPPFPLGQPAFAECLICFEWTNLHKRPCCGYAVCDDCIETYCAIQVQQRMVKVHCLNPLCTSFLGRDEILMRLDRDNKQKFYSFLVDANKDPYIKTCPRCSHVYKITPEQKNEVKFALWSKGKGLKVKCSECELLWCFKCQAPWHNDVRCKDYQRGDKLVKQWAKQHHHGQVNAQRCPKCKCLIQRSTGCDFMTCNWCMTTFCYRCGGRYRNFRFIGNHYSKLSIFGCKYMFLPKHPIRRKIIRASVLGSKILLAPLAGCAILTMGAVVGVVILPFYCHYLARKRRREKALRDIALRQPNSMMKQSKDAEDKLTYHYLAVPHPGLREEFTEVESSRIVESLDLAYWASTEHDSMPSSSESEDDRCHTSEVLVVSDARPYSSVWESSNAINTRNRSSRLSHSYMKRFDLQCDVFVHSPHEKSAAKDVTPKKPMSESSDEGMTTSTHSVQLNTSVCEDTFLSAESKSLHGEDPSEVTCSLDNAVTDDSSSNDSGSSPVNKSDDESDCEKDGLNDNEDDNEKVKDSIEVTEDSEKDEELKDNGRETEDQNVDIAPNKIDTILSASVSQMTDDITSDADGESTWL